MEELKPCPFCGGKAEICERKDWWGNKARIRDLRVHCQTKGCIGVYVSRYYQSIEEATKAWNRRADNV